MSNFLLWLFLFGAAALAIGFVVVNCADSPEDENVGFGSAFIGILAIALCLILSGFVGA